MIDQRGSGTFAENIEFVLGDSSQLTVVAIQDWADDAVHVTSHHARLNRDAVLRYTSISLGGDLVRLSATVKYDGPGGDAELLGLYFADAGQHLEQRLLVDHSQPNCKSNVVYKGALQGDPGSGKPDAHTVWIGDVLIRAAAEGTDTFELNRNLVLTDAPAPTRFRTSKSRPVRSSGPATQVQRDVSTTSSCSTCVLVVSRRIRLVVWSYVGSSTKSSTRSLFPRCAIASKPQSKPNSQPSAPDRPAGDTTPSLRSPASS